MAGNEILRRRMAEAGLTQAELAEALNLDLRTAGYAGTVSDRTVRNWLTGKSRWPHQRQRAALEAVFRCSVSDLGFAPRRIAPRPAFQEVSVLRRSFISASAGAIVAAVTPAGSCAQSRVGSGDVQRLYAKFSMVIASDHRYGGKLTIESQAAALAGEALALQGRGTAGQRIRAALYGCAASFMSSAMWAAIDGRRFDAAQWHFQRAASLATMSGDPTIQFRIWSHAGSMYRHLARPADALAANDVARHLSVTRRDPLFASLGHARHAAIQGLTGNSRAVAQSLAHAQEAMDRAKTGEERPIWLTAFYDQSELDGLAVTGYLALGNYMEAETRAHRSLANLRPGMHRTRAITTARLALAQLGQGDLEPAVCSAMAIPLEASSQHPRVGTMLDNFGTALRITAPSGQQNQLWEQYVHDLGRNPR